MRDVSESLDVSEYLAHLKLEIYSPLFETEEVDGQLLWDMCHAPDAEKELADLGVKNAFHCRKIIAKLEGYLKNT